jgi:putative ABC transport system permease protein
MGLRLALGASRGAVLWLVFSNGLLLACAGIAVGLIVAPFAGKAVGSMLFGVSAADGITFIVAPAVILLMTCLGSLGPAWKAARTEAMSALREM